MKKFISTLCLIAIISTCVVGLSACKDDDNQMKVMNVSLNPQVEFILDENDKVVSVNALNEEGNLIINGQAFVGKTSDQALQLYVSVCKETGFLVSGNVSSNQNHISISLSGEDVEDKYNSLKKNLNTYLSQNNITASILNAGQLSEDYLKQQLEKCMPNLTEQEISSMNYETLVNEMLKSRQETADLLSQSLKENYYSMKNHTEKFNEAMLVKQELDAITGAVLNTAMQAYSNAVQGLMDAREEYLISETSDYQKALATLREKQVEFLKYRNYVASLEQNEITTVITNQLDLYEKALISAKDSLQNLYTIAETALNQLEAQATVAYETLFNTMTSLNSDMQNIINQVQEDLKTEMADFKATYESRYNDYVNQAKNDWNNMKTQLTTQE